MKFENKFVKICEDVITRFQSGGIMQGDLVTIKKDALKNDHVQKMTNVYKEMLKSLMETDLNLRVSVVKSSRPTTTQNYSADTDAPTDFFVDCVVEYAPGLWRDPITVPIEILERKDTGINLAPVPDSMKRESKVSKGSEVITKDENRTNAKKNTKLAGAKEPKDGRKQVKKPVESKANTKTEKAKKIKESTLEDVYGQMLTESKK